MKRNLTLLAFVAIAHVLPWERKNYGQGAFVSGVELVMLVGSKGGGHAGPIIIPLFVGPLLLAATSFAVSGRAQPSRFMGLG